MVAEKECCNYKCILMDLNMPVMDGFEATRIINEKIKAGEFAPIDIIGVTANSQNEVIQKCLSNGFTGYVEKPIFLDDLSVALQAYFRRDHFKRD